MIQMNMIQMNKATTKPPLQRAEESLEWTEVLKNRLKAARECKGISQPTAAQLAGIDTNTLWRWENGYVKKIPIFGLRYLSAVYGVSIGWLLGQEDALSPDESDLLRMYRIASQEFRRAAVAALREGTASIDQGV